MNCCVPINVDIYNYIYIHNSLKVFDELKTTFGPKNVDFFINNDKKVVFKIIYGKIEIQVEENHYMVQTSYTGWSTYNVESFNNSFKSVI